MNRRSPGFTLLELLVVMAIMGLMATASVASYRTMRRGMEESAVLRNASQFIRLAYQRSKIDLVPVNVYFWNELRSEATSSSAMSVVGRAVAVRRHGRFTAKKGRLLLDEFGDLEVYGYVDDEGNLDAGNTSYQNDEGMYLYRINGSEQDFQRSLVSRISASHSTSAITMISYPDTEEKTITSYGFYLLDRDQGKVDWQKGDAYGLEFADLELPNGYIFGSTYSESITSPVSEIKVFNFNPVGRSGDGGSLTIQVSSIRPGDDGSPTAKRIDNTTAPNRDQIDQE